MTAGLVSLGLLILLQVLPVTARADGCPCTEGLESHIGSRNINALITDSRVDAPLRSLLGDALPHLIDNLDVAGAIDLVDGALSLAGNAVHGGGLEEAVLCVSLRDGSVSAAIFSENRITVYSQRTRYVDQTLCIKDWITLVNSGHTDRLQMPANVRMKLE